MIQDTSEWVRSFGSYVYGDNVAQLTEEMPTKLSLTNAAGRNGKRIGENFQDIKRLVVSGKLTEEGTGTSDEVPLRVTVQRFRFAHRAEVGKQRLVLNGAADGRPAEYVLAAVEAVTGLKWEAPITETDFEVSFVAEPEIWYDLPTTLDLRQNPVGASPNTTYSRVVTYAGPDGDFFADADAVPIITLTVTGITDELLEVTDDLPYVNITNSNGTQSFLLYPQSNDTFIMDSYQEGIRKGATWAGGTIYEFADYEQFIYLHGAPTGAGVAQTISVACHKCDVSAASLTYIPRHW